MKTSFPVFLRRGGKRSHEEVVICIDWADVDLEDMKKMAAFYILRRAEHELKDYDTALPESVEFRAADYLHNEPLVTVHREIPAKWKEPPKSKSAKEFEKAVAGLSPDEIRALFNGA